MASLTVRFHAWFAILVSLLLPLAAQASGIDTTYARYRSSFNDPDLPSLEVLIKALRQVKTLRGEFLVSSAGYALRQERMLECLLYTDSLLDGHLEVEPHWLTDAYKLRAQVHLWAGDLESGMQEIEQSIEIADSALYPKERIAALMIKAELHLASSGHPKAMKALTEAQRLAEKVNDGRGKCMVNLLLGNLRFQQKEYEQALELFLRTNVAATTGGWPLIARNALSNWASCNIMLQRFDEALSVCDSLLSLPLTETAVRAQLLSHIGYILREQGRPLEALSPLRESIILSRSLGEPFEALKAEQHLAGALWKLGRQKEAIETLEKCIGIARDLDRPRTELEMHRTLKRWYRSSGEFERAMAHADAYSAINDSLKEIRYGKEMALAERRFQSERKDHQIVQQKQALRLAEEKDRKKSLQRNALLGVATLLLLLALLLYRSIRARQRLAKKEKELHNEKIDQLLSQQEMKSINAMLEGQEQERARVSKELHDHVGHLLGTIKHQLGQLEEQVADVKSEQTVQYRKVTGLLDNAAGALRRISHDMAAATLNRFGLEKALKDLRDTIHINGRLQVELNTFGLENPLERGVEIAVYRIVQEAVSNVLKHAQANEMSIAVTHAPGRMSVLVSDNGQGFDTDQTSHGVGLANIRSRAATLGAQVQIDSTPGKGTTVSVECPVVE